MRKIILIAILLSSIFALGQNKDSSKIKTHYITINIDSFKQAVKHQDSVDDEFGKIVPMIKRNKLKPDDFSFEAVSEKQSNVLSISVLAFGLILSIAVMIWLYKMKKGLGNFTFKTLGIILILTACLFLVVAGYDVEQITPVIGLLGTIAGFIFGSSSNSNNSTGGHTNS